MSESRHGTAVSFHLFSHWLALKSTQAYHSGLGIWYPASLVAGNCFCDHQKIEGNRVAVPLVFASFGRLELSW